MLRINALAVCLFAVCGCAGESNDLPPPQQPGKEAALTEVAGLLRTAVTESGHGPQKLSDLARFEHGYPLGYAAIKSGDVVVIWGAKAAPEGEVAAGRAGQNIIAYEKQTPTEGGLVLLENGTIKRMTAEEFKAAPKAR